MDDDSKGEIFLLSPAYISALHVGDLISTKRVVVACCNNGAIALWKTSKLMCSQRPNKVLYFHNEAVVSLCFLNGHLLSLDERGALFMWSGHDLENESASPNPRALVRSSSLTS